MRRWESSSQQTQVHVCVRMSRSLWCCCRFEAEERAVRTLAAQGQAEAAAAAAQRLFSAASEAGQTLPAVRILLLLARVHWGAGAPLLALPYLLSCRSHCRQLHLDVLGAEAAVLLVSRDEEDASRVMRPCACYVRAYYLPVSHALLAAGQEPHGNSVLHHPFTCRHRSG